MSSRTDQIYERIYTAIIEQALRPGSKLGEEALCGIFGVSRTLVRRVLHRLAGEHVVELLPNRGAFVARPSIAEARDASIRHPGAFQFPVKRAAKAARKR